MSTKTNFKRIALVAVAALGMGVLSSVPSNAAITGSGITLTTTAGTATTTKSESATGAAITATWLASATTDSMTITVAAKSKPAANVAYPKGWLTVIDTAGSVNAGALWGFDPSTSMGTTVVRLDSLTATASSVARDSWTSVALLTGTANTYSTLNLKLNMEMSAAGFAAGTYVYTITATPASGTTLGTADAKSIDVSIVVTANVTKADQSYSTAYLSSSATSYGAPTPGGDSTVAVSAVASATSKATLQVTLRSPTNTTTFTDESVTVTTNIGSLGGASGTATGKNVTFKYTAGSPLTVFIFADGTAGVATIQVTTTNYTAPAKTVTFYNTTSTKITAVQGATTIAVGSNAATANGGGVIWAKATDANGATVVADADGNSGVFAYSDALTVVSDSGTACTYNSATGYHFCPLTGLTAGTANITLRQIGTGAASTVNSSAIKVTVSNSAPVALKMAFDKATYAPGERAYLKVWAVDSAGKNVSPRTITGLFASGGITSNSSFSTGGSGLPTGSDATVGWTVAALSPTTLVTSTEAVAIYTVFMPFSGGTVTVSATGGAALPAAGQVAVTATASVTDSGAAALAAVTALATTVASLKTLITTLTNLVLKIQKKVKA